LNQNINFYNDNAEQLTEQYKSVQANVVHGSWAQLLLQFNESTKTALDIGAGSGRDASWLANHNFKVTAVEPANKLLTQAQINYATTTADVLLYYSCVESNVIWSIYT
jgi:protein-L-isoaspartate O-methyltransferase